MKTKFRILKNNTMNPASVYCQCYAQLADTIIHKLFDGKIEQLIQLY